MKRSEMHNKIIEVLDSCNDDDGYTERLASMLLEMIEAEGMMPPGVDIADPYNAKDYWDDEE